MFDMDFIKTVNLLNLLFYMFVIVCCSGASAPQNSLQIIFIPFEGN